MLFCFCFFEVSAWWESNSGQKCIDPQHTLYDIRDGESYRIRKLADGNCWMTENLRLRFTNQTVPLTASTSDLNSKSTWTPSHLTQTEAGILWNGTEAFSYDNVEYVLYNWIAAIAKEGEVGGSNDDGQPDSICPKNWQLPYRKGHVNKGIDYLLLDIYGLANGQSGNNLSAIPLDLTSANYYREDGTVKEPNTEGYFWSKNWYWNAETNRWQGGRPRYNPRTGFITMASDWIGLGYPVRCVSR